MKRTKVQITAPAQSSAGNEYTLEQWSSLQFEAKGRGLAVDAILAERGQSETQMTQIELPTAFVALVNEALAARFIPARHLSRGLASTLLAVHLDDGCLLWSSYTFPSRLDAQAVAMCVFARESWRSSLVLKYRDGVGVADEIFRNSSRNLNAA